MLIIPVISLADVSHYDEEENFYDNACTNLVDENVQSEALVGYFRGVYDVIGWEGKDVTLKEMKKRCREADKKDISFRLYVIDIVK